MEGKRRRLIGWVAPLLVLAMVAMACGAEEEPAPPPDTAAQAAAQAEAEAAQAAADTAQVEREAAQAAADTAQAELEAAQAELDRTKADAEATAEELAAAEEGLADAAQALETAEERAAEAEQAASEAAVTTMAAADDDMPEAWDLVRVGQSAPVQSLDPTIAAGAPSYVPGTLVSGQLYRFNFAREPEFDLLEAEEVSTDGLTVTHTLRPDAVYSDGSPVVAEDVVVALARQREGASAGRLVNIVSVEATDERTVVWTFAAPTPQFPDILAQHHLLIHPHGRVNEPAYFESPVSAGPYVIDEWIPGTDTMLVSVNPNYWRTPVVQAIEFVSIADMTSRVLQLAQGELDYVYDLPPSAVGSFPADMRVFAHPLGGLYHIVTNLPAVEGPLADPRIRQVISLAMDRQDVSERAFFGLSEPGCAFLFKAAPEHECILPNDGMQDLDAARALLAQTPYADGFTFELQVWTRPGWPDAALVISENLAEIGITAEVLPLEDAVAREKLISGNFTMQFSGAGSTPNPASAGASSSKWRMG